MLYLLTVTLTFLSSANWIECRYEVHRTISKIFTTGNRRFMYSQRIGILKYRVPLMDKRGRLNIGKIFFFWNAEQAKHWRLSLHSFCIEENKCISNYIMNKYTMQLYCSSSILSRYCSTVDGIWSLYYF